MTQFLTSAAWARVGELAARLTVGQIEAGIGIDGQAFKPKANGAPATLDESGNLKRSIRVLEAAGDRAVVGSELDYAPHVDAARPCLGVAPDNLDKLDRAMIDAIDLVVRSLL